MIRIEADLETPRSLFITFTDREYEGYASYWSRLIERPEFHLK